MSSINILEAKMCGIISRWRETGGVNDRALHYPKEKKRLLAVYGTGRSTKRQEAEVMGTEKGNSISLCPPGPLNSVIMLIFAD